MITIVIGFGVLAMDLLTVKETAQILRVSPITVRRYIASGKLAAERVGGGIRVRREAIEGFVTPVVSSATRLAVNTKKPSTILEAMGISVESVRSGEPTIIAEHKHDYVADAYADLHDEDSESAELRGKPFTMNDPLWSVFGGEGDDLDDSESDEVLPTLREQMGNIIGIGRSSGPTDVSANKYKYLAEAFESDRG